MNWFMQELLRSMRIIKPLIMIHYIGYFLVITILSTSCTSNKEVNKETKPQKFSTIKRGVVYPIQIGNEKGHLTIKRILKKSSNEFSIQLKNIPEVSLYKKLNKLNLYKSLKEESRNKANKTMIENSRLDYMTYEFVRANTL